MGKWPIPPECLSIIPKLRILLLGSYHTKYGLPQLESLKNYLVQKGFINCRLTKDFNTPPKMRGEFENEYNLRKSKYWMRNADILVFVFFPQVDNASVAIELQYAYYSIPDSTWRTILAYTENPPSLVSGFGRSIREISIAQFLDDKELHEQVYGCIIARLYRLYDMVSIRPAGEWETSLTVI